MEISESNSSSATILSFKGRLDAITCKDAQDKMKGIVDRGATNLIVDLSGLTYVNSAGLRIFISCGKQLKIVNGKLIFCGLQEYIKELFEMAGFPALFPIHDRLSDAEDALKTIPS